MILEKYTTSSCQISKHSVYKNRKLLFANKGADVPGFLLSVYKHFDINYSRFYKMDNLSKLGWLASEILLKDSFKKDNYRPEDIGLILSNTNSSLDTDQKYMESVNDFPRSSLFVYTLPNIVTGEICIRNNFKGENAFFVFDSFNAGFIENYVSSLLDNNVLQACICGWIELLGNEYKAVLFLVEKLKSIEAVAFTKEQMNIIFED
ncbi:MAG TPA: hypothetical protein VIL78_00920 [Hanamia sp.]